MFLILSRSFGEMRAVLSSGLITCASSCPDLRSLVLLCCFACPQPFYIVNGATLQRICAQTFYLVQQIFVGSWSFFFPLIDVRILALIVRNLVAFAVCNLEMKHGIIIVFLSFSRRGHGLLMVLVCSLWRTL